MVEMCSVHVRKSISHNICIYIYCKRYTFRSFLALNSTHIISEVPNLTSTFVLMLIVIILSFIISGDIVEVCSVHVKKSISHTVRCKKSFASWSRSVRDISRDLQARDVTNLRWDRSRTVLAPPRASRHQATCTYVRTYVHIRRRRYHRYHRSMLAVVRTYVRRASYPLMNKEGEISEPNEAAQDLVRVTGDNAKPRETT